MATAASTPPSEPAVRYSTARVLTSPQAQSFSWEHPIPVSPFWDPLPYPTSACFLNAFASSPAELAALPIDPASTAPNPEKITLLLSLLQAKLAREQQAITTTPLHIANHPLWSAITLGIASLQSQLPDQLAAAEVTIRALADHRIDKANLGPLHMLADHLVKVGKFVEAEETERAVLRWMEAHERLGRDSPQALGARRIIVRAMWGQGRRTEAEEMMREIEGIVEGLGEGSRFGVYQEEERGLFGQLVGELRR
ncbi:hypothetical protein B0T17DRAFT_543665 [Bombardia bombarda]|uniref:Uncharacterized protein n=1 Tax=Bombardia bombarda TaxID=252184 RepID=A0AA39WAQ2_9PEZI|nr:hypothetical protein B0T17DRAFT_543665 [Bombardia bombarda]